MEEKNLKEKFNQLSNLSLIEQTGDLKIKIMYIKHSCFLIEFEYATMIFDYYDGKLPEMRKEKPLYVFVSHKHQDHYNKSIFKWSKEHPQVYYFLSNDLKMNEKYMERLEIPQEAQKHIYFLGKRKEYVVSYINGEMIFQKHTALEKREKLNFDLNQKQNLSQERNLSKTQSLNQEQSFNQTQNLNQEKDTILIQTLRSTDEGVAFIIYYEGKRIYHAGDLNWWTWKGEKEEKNKKMTEQFLEEMEWIKGQTFDVAFLPLDYRQEEMFYLGFDYFMKMTKTKLAVPMHCWGDYSVISKLKEMECSKEYKENIAEITKEGEIFFI